MRARASVLPPAPKGTITVIGLDGQVSCARGRGPTRRGDDDKCQDAEGAQHAILSAWQVLHEMIAKNCSLSKPTSTPHSRASSNNVLMGASKNSSRQVPRNVTR